MLQRRFNRVAVAVGLVSLLVAVGASLAGAYAEEPLPFRDPLTGQVDHTVEVSTIHTDLTYVLALAAGFSEADSRTLTIWDQLVDTNLITTKDGSYTNCAGTFPPKIAEERCEDPRDGDRLFWPSWNNPAWGPLPLQGPGTSCVTSRYGPFEGFFHFPHRDGSEMAALKAWGWGDAGELKGYQGYVWGPPKSQANPDGMSIDTGFYGNTCFYTEAVTIDTGMAPGSLQAFATYLHSLADSYSHQECQKKTEPLGWAWPTHTSPYGNKPIYECNYAPTGYLKYIGDSHHGREFGAQWIESDSNRTDKAIRAVYTELVARSSQREGVYGPLSLNARLSGRFHQLTLDEALYYFVHKWYFNQPEARRAYADQLAAAILALRVPVH